MTQHTFPFKAAIFDMDGLIIDSEPIQSQSLEIMLRKYNKTPQYQENGLIQKVGVSSDENLKRILPQHDIDEDFQTFAAKRRAVYKSLLEEKLWPMPGLVDLLKLLKEDEIKTAVSSSSSLEGIMYIVKKLEIEKYFNDFVSGRDVPRNKPFPDVYVEAARRLYVDQKDCIAFEDSETGVQAAYDAGIKVIAVPGKYTQHHNFEKAYKKITSLTQATSEFLSHL